MASKEMVVFCFDTLHHHFFETEEPKAGFDTSTSFPLFVTWEIESDTDSALELRGCIGTLVEIKLENLQAFALKSALKDQRFEPIQPKELSKLHCTVSLLINFEAAENYKDWQVGVHGIIIDFDVDDTRYHATYLPDVAHERGWNHTETICSLMRKAGFNGQVSKNKLENMKVTRYCSSKEHLSYEEYLACSSNPVSSNRGD
uniref:Predicted protein putative n=1 Tax=Albugo laibachii Nc14 TaxID=890382 RepID=F0W4T7_9STRA|nr:predicted protein putative [Albugo laibachii Nc14]|eukprot:CCA16124.1 predicted protein putative [Albugo laibachii Nc14]